MIAGPDVSHDSASGVMSLLMLSKSDPLNLGQLPATTASIRERVSKNWPMITESDLASVFGRSSIPGILSATGNGCFISSHQRSADTKTITTMITGIFLYLSDNILSFKYMPITSQLVAIKVKKHFNYLFLILYAISTFPCRI